MNLEPLTEELLTYHEGLRSNHVVTSEATIDYNCIAWAVNDQSEWWWPTESEEDAHWPDGVERKATPENFAAALATKDFEPCDSPDQGDTYEVVALYALNGVPTHGARLVRQGAWTSKLGYHQDVEHPTVDALHDDVYGEVYQYFRREIKSAEEGQATEDAKTSTSS